MAGEIIRPSALPPRADPVASEIVPSDNGSVVGGVTWAAGVAAGRPLASQAEAEAGVDAAKAMTPLTTKQAIDAQVPPKIDTAIEALNLGSAAQAETTDFATAAQGAVADSAVQPSRTISAGTGLTGGGTLAANRTLSLNAGSIASLAKADSAVQSVVAGTNVIVDDTDPLNPVVSVSSSAGGMPVGYLFGLTLSNSAGDPTNDINIAEGECASQQTPSIAMAYAGSGVNALQLDVAYGSGNGARFDSSISDGTWHVFIISNGTTVSRGMSKSLDPTSAANYPSGYAHYRRIGSVMRTSGALVAFVQDGDNFTLAASVTGFAATNPGTSAVTQALAGIPTGIRVRAKGVLYLSTNTTSFLSVVRISDLAAPDAAPAASANQTIVIQTLPTASFYRVSNFFEEFTNTSAQVRVRCSASDANFVVTGVVLGWVDPRGRL